MENLYASPNKAFRGQWPGWNAFLGTGKSRPKRSSVNRTLEQRIVFAESLAKEHGGVLPSATWIQKNHSGLYEAMRRHPNRFEHIPQEKPQGHFRNLDQNVALAEALAKDHGGILPRAKWIQKNHAGLAHAIRKHPKRFEHIPQGKPNRAMKEWVAFAEALAKKHGGVLPHARWIRENHSGLETAIRQHPELFSGFRQEVRGSKGRLIGYRELGTSEAS